MGMFEVTKAEEEEKSSNSPPASPNAGNNMSGQSHISSNSKMSALRVTIPSELQGVAYIEVLCQKGNVTKRRKKDLSKNILYKKYMYNVYNIHVKK